MKFNSVRLQHFGCFEDYEITFQPGLNVIKGPNEAGKSTLHRALLMSVLEKPEQSEAGERYRTWQQERWYTLSVKFETEKDGVWTLIKDFETESQEIIDASGQASDNPELIEGIIEDSLGTSSLSLFKSTACVTQDALAELSAGREEIARGLEQVIIGDEDDIRTASVINTLNEKVGDYKRGYLVQNSENPGPIGRLQAEYERLQDRARSYQETLGNVELSKDGRWQIRDKVQALVEQIEANEALLGKAAKTQALQSERDQWAKRERAIKNRLDQITEVEKTFAEAQEELEALLPVSRATEEQIQSVARLHERVDVLEKALARQENSHNNRTDSRGPSLVAPAVVSAMGILGILAGFGYLVVSENRLGGVILAGLGLLIVVIGAIWLILVSARSRPSSEAPPLTEVSGQDLLDARAELDAKLAEFLCKDFSEFEEKWRTAQVHKKGFEAAAVQLKTLVPEGQTKDNMEAGYRIALEKRLELEESLQDPDGQQTMGLSPADIEDLQNSTAALEREKKDLEASLLRLEGRLEEMSATREALLQTEEQLAVVESDLKRAKERLAVYELALETMQAARSNTLKRAGDELAPRMGKYLEQLTLGRYREVDVDDDLYIRVRHPGNPTTLVSTDRLSTGTRDQLYMAARLALIDLLFQGAVPPIFMDDPFVKFDPQRRQAAVNICRQLGEERQILLFTCADHYDEAGHLIELEGIELQEEGDSGLS